MKIDQSFIRDLSLDSGDDALVKAIIAMGQSLNLDIIAEGVESSEQLAFLQQHDCNFAQGYYFSNPVSADEIKLMIKEQRNLFN